MKNLKIKLFVIAIVGIFLATGFSNAETTHINTLEDSFAKWTVMMYLAFDTHRDAEKEATFNILKEIGSNLDFNLVALYDGLENDDTNYFCIEEDSAVPLGWHESEADMGQADTLKDFIEYSQYSYPADNYAIFICSTHGSGWQGLGCDTSGTATFSTLSLLDMTDYKNVLKEVTNDGSEKIDVICYEICVTASIEVAYQIAPYVNYMAATEEHGFGPNEFSDIGTPLEWNYSYFLKNLKDNPDTSPEYFAASISNSYIPGTYTPKFRDRYAFPRFYPVRKYHTTLSATNLTKINSSADAVKNLGTVLSENINSCRRDIKEARRQTREYGKLYRKFFFLPSMTNFALQFEPTGYDCFIDLYDFAYNLKQISQNEDIADACDQVMQEIDNAVIANNCLPDDNSHGLFIYFPEHKIQYDQSIWRLIGNPQFRKLPTSYEDIGFSEYTEWNEFVKEYLKI